MPVKEAWDLIFREGRDWKDGPQMGYAFLIEYMRTIKLNPGLLLALIGIALLVHGSFPPLAYVHRTGINLWFARSGLRRVWSCYVE